MHRDPPTLKGDFGALLDDVRPADLEDEGFRERARALWFERGGLVAVRGAKLAAIPPETLMSWARNFGDVEETAMSARDKLMVPGFPIMRIGNIRDETGERRALFSKVPALSSEADIRYNPRTKRPVWHTDSTFRRNPPIGSVFHCRQAPPRGGETLFADTRAAYAALDDVTRERLRSLEAVCSLAHHDKKISLYSPDYPTLTPEQRAANPPRRVPLVLVHPVSGQPALYGMNSSTCTVVPVGQPVSEADMDRFDLEGVEDESVAVLRDLLPHITGPEFALAWAWQPGDIVVWDNRCTVHAATGFDDDQHPREMWRLTLVDAHEAQMGAQKRA